MANGQLYGWPQATCIRRAHLAVLALVHVHLVAQDDEGKAVWIAGAGLHA